MKPKELHGWEAIGAAVGRCGRSARLWEAERKNGFDKLIRREAMSGRVYAYQEEIKQWIQRCKTL